MRKFILLLLACCMHGVVVGQKAHKTGLTHFKQYKEDKNQSIYFADFDASRRGTIIVQELDSSSKNPIRILSEPPPDAIVAFTTSLSNSLKFDNKFTTSQTADFGQAIKELTKRNTTIVVLRDALYRLNEYAFNNPEINDSIYFKKFDKILDLVEEINAKETIETETEKAKVEAELLLSNQSFSENENLGAKKNYQIAIQKLFNEDIDDAKIYFDALYKKYPIHFRIDEINKELKKLGGKISDEDRKKLYDFIISNTFGIEKEVVEQIKEEIKKIK